MTLKVIGIVHFCGLLRDLKVFQSQIGMFMANHMNSIFLQ